MEKNEACINKESITFLRFVWFWHSRRGWNNWKKRMKRRWKFYFLLLSTLLGLYCEKNLWLFLFNPGLLGGTIKLGQGNPLSCEKEMQQKLHLLKSYFPFRNQPKLNIARGWGHLHLKKNVTLYAQVEIKIFTFQFPKSW